MSFAFALATAFAIQEKPPAPPELPRNVVLRPHIRLRSGRPSATGTAFLARPWRGADPLMITALHLFKSDGNQLASESLDEAVAAVDLYTLKRDRKIVTAVKSRIRTGHVDMSSSDISGDVAAFAMDESLGFSPFSLLLAKETPMADEPVWVVGDEFDSPNPQQKLWPAKTLLATSDIVTFTLTENATLPGFSGSPVVNRAGHVVGLVSATNGRFVFAVGVSSLLKHLKKSAGK